MESAHDSPKGGGRLFSQGSKSRRRLYRIFLVLALVLLPISVLSVWARDTVTDTDKYVETVAPLAQNPDIQAAVTTKLSSRIQEKVNVGPTLAKVLPQQAVAVLKGPVEGVVDNYITTAVMHVVASSQFESIWVAANRAAHKQLLRLLEGPTNSTNTRELKLGTIQVNLEQVVMAVRTHLVAAGFQPIERVPNGAISGRIALYQSKSVKNLQTVFNLLKTLGDWTPIAALLSLIAAFYLSGNRRRTAMVAGIWIVVTVVIVGIIGHVIQTAYLNAINPDVVPPRAAAAAFSVLVRFLRQYYLQLATVGAIMYLVGLYLGPSTGAVKLRDVVHHASRVAGNWLEEKHILPMRLRNVITRYVFMVRLVILTGCLVLAFLVGGWPGEVLALVVAAVTLGIVECATMPASVQPQDRRGVRQSPGVPVSSS